MAAEKPNKTDLRAIFLGLQDQLNASLTVNREIVEHPSAKGEASELQWLTMLRNHLPERYQMDKAFVLDYTGSISDQIDVVIYDRQYSPLLFNQHNTKYLPAESVYAVFEIRQELNAGNITYAAEKTASVRRLQRTSAPIPYAGGRYEPKPPPPIISGILTLSSEWNPPLGGPFHKTVITLPKEGRLDMGCALKSGAFHVEYAEGKEPIVNISKPESALIFFFLKLLAKLQQSGTVADAFQVFKSELELPDQKQKLAALAQQEIRTQIAKYLWVYDSILTGSYARHTKIDPSTT
jgi:Domain of unknown function (DUF6602)